MANDFIDYKDENVIVFKALADSVAAEKSSEAAVKDDPVNHPAHYTKHPSGVECIEIAKWYDFCIGNCIKYIWRAGLKSESGMTDNAKKLEDLKKARWYLDKEIHDIEAGIK